jgi:hypothetical protein
VLFKDEIAADIGGLSSLCDDRQCRTASTAEVIEEPDEVVQPPGFRQGSITTGGSFSEHSFIFHNQTVRLFLNLKQLRNEPATSFASCKGHRRCIRNTVAACRLVLVPNQCQAAAGAQPTRANH